MSLSIICGFGIVGKSVFKVLNRKNEKIIAIDKKEEVFKGFDIPKVIGDASTEEILTEAGIQNANTLIACTDNDVSNAFIILAAQDLNSDLVILSRADKLANVDKLYKAGADYVLPLTVIGGRRIAKQAISPLVADFLDRLTLAQGIELGCIIVSEKSNLIGVKLKNSKIRERTKTTIIAIERKEELIVNPSIETEFKENDSLIVIGDGEEIKKLSEIAKGS